MVILIGSQNYLAWKRETKFYLAGKGLAGHIDGTTIQPMKARAGNGGEDKTMEVDRESAEWMAWFKEDMRCITKIRMRIAPMIRDTIGDDLCTAKELWELLESRYGRTSGYSRALAMRNIYLCQMRRDRSPSPANMDATSRTKTKRIIEDEERRLSDLHSLKRFQPVAQTPSNSLLSDDTALVVIRVRCFKCHDGTPKQQQHGKRKNNRQRQRSKKSDNTPTEAEKANIILAVRGGNHEAAWLGDSGSTIHVCGPAHRHLLHNVQELQSQRVVQGFAGGGKPVSAKFKGNLVIKTVNGLRTIEDVNYFPQSSVSLFSLTTFNQRGFDFGTRGGSKLVVSKNSVDVLTFTRNGRLFELEGRFIPPERVCTLQEIDVWHRRLGHVSTDKLHKLAKNGFVMPYLSGQSLSPSDVCLTSNLKRQPFNSTKVQPDLPDTVSVDLLFFSAPSLEGHTCALNVVTHDHRLSFVAPLKRKSDALQAFGPFFAYYKTQRNTSIKHVKCDGGGDFAGQFRAFQEKKGVELHVTLVKPPTQRHCRKDSLPKSFWSDALTCAVYLRNRLPATFLDGKTPIEAISGRQPNMAYIRRFGQHCYIVHPSGRKPDDRGSKCILLGFASLGYKVLELSTRRVTFSRHCAFVDDFGVSSHAVDLSSFDTVFAPDSSGPIPVNDNGSSTSISLDDVDTVDVANPPPVLFSRRERCLLRPFRMGERRRLTLCRVQVPIPAETRLEVWHTIWTGGPIITKFINLRANFVILSTRSSSRGP
ncbi:hypothetical protein AeMF1_003201 [Aphanomyces euteiches]|nr:hypothetical protein AeMF1_003201 [Aphanomyces euteiches]